ncbi:MAG: DUF2059 domain-containing protein [Xanthobacteraceae bacterium]
MIATPYAGVFRAALLACILAGFSAPALAQKPPSANAIAIAKEIVILKGSSAMLDPMIPGVIERVKFMHMQTNPMLQKPLNEVALALRKEYAKRSADLLTGFAKTYASHFTEAELKQVLAFYKTPAGKKVIAEEPRIFDDSMKQLKAWQDKFSQEMIARFRTEMRKRGHDL